VRVGEHPDDLVAALAADLNLPRDDPFEADLVTVATPGQGRWLMQRLGTVLGTAEGCTDGVAARIELPTTVGMLRDLEREVLGITPRDDPWVPERLAWTMLRAFDRAADEPWFRDIAVHVGDAERPGRRYGAARRFCDLFARYARWRPELLTTPATGSDAWQHELWTLLVAMVGEQTPWDRTTDAAERLRANPSLSSLPSRLSVWAPQRLAPGERSLLAALGSGRDVSVWWPAASTDDRHLLAHRLGAASRAALGALARAAEPAVIPRGQAEPPTLLGRLQRLVRTGEVQHSPADATIRVHLSHGLDRQVEVLRDVLCDLYEAYPDLEPRDVVVCTPKLEDVAPLVRALCMVDPELVGPNAHPVSRLRVQVTDPSTARTNPVLDVLARVMDLATSRAQVGDLLALCATAPVARRFRLDTERLETLGELLERAGVRWGIDAASRESFGVPGINQNTWLAGLNRLLLGVAMSERELMYVSSVLPLDMVDSSDLDLVGAVAEIIAVVRKAVASFARSATPAGWVTRFRELLDHLVAVSGDDGWQLGHAQLLLADLVTASGDEAPPVGLGDMRHLVTDWLAAHPPRSTLLTGSLTVTTLEALRHVPHRVVCLVGLDEASFPRTSRRTGDDLLERAGDAEDPHASLDDRQLFLDALMAARDAFVVVCAARDQRTNDELPLPAPVADLLDAVRGLGVSDDEVLVPHALQPYEIAAEATYDRAAVQARTSLLITPRRAAQDRFEVAGLPPVTRPQAVTLTELVAFLRHPAREFLRKRVGSWWGITRSELDTDDDERGTGRSEIPIEVQALDSWSLENRLLHLALAGHPPESIEQAELRRGLLPPLARGAQAMATATGRVGEVLDTVRPYLSSALDHLDVGVELPSGVRITGRVPVRGRTVVEAITSKPADKRLIEPWLRLLLLNAGSPGEWSAAVCSRRRIVTLGGRGADAASAQLDSLVSLMVDGWDNPLPLPPRLGYALADPRAMIDEQRRAEIWKWDTDPTWQLFFGDYAELESAATRWGGLERLAQDTYGPLLEAQR
jgi:exodeoxyribonuclease V gamma subunit